MDHYASEDITLVVHELRSPLAFVATAVRLLAEESPTPEVRDRCGVIERTVLRLLRVSESVLDSSGALHTDAPLQLYRPAEVVRALVEDERRLGCPVMFLGGAAEPARTACGRPDLFEALIHSLLNNALDHRPEEGTVTVSVTSVDEELRVEIRNEVSSADRHRGLGLGTVISGCLATAAGAIVRSSAEGGWFSSTVRLALLPPEPAAHTPLREPSPATLHPLLAVGASA